MEFQFEPRNFIAGLLGGWATAFAVYQARHILGGIRRSFTERAESTRQYSLGSAEGRYVGELVTFCQSNHLAGGTIELSEIAVEPRFIPVEPLAAPPDEDVNRDPFRIMPYVHDHPYLYAAYHIVTASINDLNSGDRAIALLGLPGSGRTTALQLIALWSLGEVDFKAPMDSVQMQLEAEEATLKAEERAVRVKDRMTIEERAYERLAQEQGEDYDAGDARKSGVPLLKRLLPLYVHLANIDLSEFNRRADPAEPLVRAIQFQVGSVTRKTVPRKLYDRLNKGTALVLLDGFDELPEAERGRMIPWLRAFLREYRRNFIIIAGPATGFGDLTRLGFAPVYLRPWHDQQAFTAAEKWANNWSAITGVRRRDNQRPAERLVQAAKGGVRALPAFDLSLRLRGIYTGELQESATQIEAMQAYLRAVGMTDGVLGMAAVAAALQLDEGFITLKRLEDIAVGRPSPVRVKLPPARKADVDAMFQLDEVDDEAEIDALFSNADIAAAEPTPVEMPAASIDKKEQARIAKEQAQLLTSLERMGLIQRYKGGRYQFRYPLVAAYLASLTLASASTQTLQEKALEPEWEWALAYAAGHSTIDTAVQAHLETPPDLLYANLLTVTRWLAYAPAKANWRVEVMKRLGNLFVHPAQFPLVSERMAAALVGSRDKNALVVFQKALKNPDPKIRLLACLAIGAMGEADAIGAMQTMMRDPDADVQLAAALALGAIGSVEALEVMGTALVQGSEQLQRAAAEMFAAHPEEGYPVLYEAVQSEDIGLRRAAVFGLKRVSAPWALLAIYRVFLEDQQWYVRSAAQQVFIDMQDESGRFTRSYPNLETIPWLREWLEALGEEGSTEGPDAALVKMLQEGNPQMQAVSAEAMGQLGMADKLDELYATLLHDDEGVRVAAHRGLAAIQQRLGEELPAPV